MNQLPFNVKTVAKHSDFDILEDESGNQYLLLVISLKDYQTYFDLTKYSKSIVKSIYETKSNDKILLVFNGFDYKTEDTVKGVKLLPVFKEIFDASSYEITLKKEHFKNLNNTYKLLDNKFSYFEMRIREVETAPVKDDVSWVVLSKYHVLLDAKIYLYDLQQDIFKYIDKKEIIQYGLIFRKMNPSLYHQGKILPVFDLYYGPIGMLYARYYLSMFPFLSLDKFRREVLELDAFNRKYFGFMVLYILILNLNLEAKLGPYTIMSYLSVTKLMKMFMLEFKECLEK